MNNDRKKPDNSPDPFWLDHQDRQNRTHFSRRPSWRERHREQTILDWFGPELGRNEIQARQQPAAAPGHSLDNLMRELGKDRQVILEKINLNIKNCSLKNWDSTFPDPEFKKTR